MATIMSPLANPVGLCTWYAEPAGAAAMKSDGYTTVFATL